MYTPEQLKNYILNKLYAFFLICWIIISVLGGMGCSVFNKNVLGFFDYRNRQYSMNSGFNLNL